MRQGLPPLAYHRVSITMFANFRSSDADCSKWLLPRSQRARYQPHLMQPQNDFSFYQAQNGNGEGYGMHAFPPPGMPTSNLQTKWLSTDESAYNQNHEAPPTYQPPMGSSKVNPSQDYAVPPPGAPPSFGSSNSSQRDGPIYRPAESHGMNSLNPFR